MIGGLLSNSASRLALVAAAGLFIGGVAVPSAKAADLGGDCCADLEERVAELEATTARKGNRRMSLTITGHINRSVMYWNDGRDSKTVYGVDNTQSSTRFSILGEARVQPRLKVGFSEAEIGVDQHSVRIDVQAYRTRQQSWFLRTKESSRCRHEDQFMGVVAQRRGRQSLHEGLAVVSYALLDCDEKVALLSETIFEMLMVDDLHGLRLHAAPVCGSVSDDFSWKEFDRRQRPSERLRRRSADRGRVGILM